MNEGMHYGAKMIADRDEQNNYTRSQLNLHF
jgi:hypothetical protein